MDAIHDPVVELNEHLDLLDGDESPPRILSIDPSTTYVGFAVADIVDDYQRFHLHTAFTNDLSRIAKRMDNGFAHESSTRMARLRLLRDIVKRLMIQWRPSIVCCESNYMDQNASSFAGLVEAVAAIRSGVESHCHQMMVRMVAPSVVKNGVGVSGGSRDKYEVRDRLMVMPDIVTDGVVFTTLDSHSTDAIAVGYSYYRMMRSVGKQS